MELVRSWSSCAFSLVGLNQATQSCVAAN